MNHSNITKNRIAFLFWLVLFLTPVGIYGTLGVSGIVRGILFISASYFLGSYVLGFFPVFRQFFGSIMYGGTSILIGQMILLPSLMIHNAYFLVIYFLIAFVVVGYARFHFKKHIIPISVDGESIWSIILSIIIVGTAAFVMNYYDFQTWPFSFPVYNGVTNVSDSAYFTSIVDSFKNSIENGAVYEYGSPINYHSFSLIFASLFQKFTEAPPFVALYGYWLPFIIFLFYFSLIDLTKYFSKCIDYKYPWYIIMVPIIFISLQPLNPFYLLKGDVFNFVWGGVGFIGPGGNVPSTFSMLLTVYFFYCLIFWSHNKFKNSWAVFLLLLTLLILLLLTKITFFVSASVFAGFLVLFESLREKKYAPLLVLCGIGCIAVIIYSLLSVGGGITQVVWSPGYYMTYFSSLMNVRMGYLLLLLVVGLHFIWLGPRLIIFTGIWLKKKQISDYATASLLTILVLLLFPLLLRIHQILPDGKMVDRSYDLAQFVRSSYFLSSLIASTTFLFFMNKRRLMIAVPTLVCIVLTLSSFSVRYTKKQDVSWKETQYHIPNELKLKGRFAVVPIDNYRSIQLAASGIGYFYSAMNLSDEYGKSGYNTSTVNMARWEVMDRLYKGDQETKLNCIQTLMEADVDYLIILKDYMEPIKGFKIVYENEGIAVQALSVD